MNFEMKHNGSRIFNGTTGPSQSNLHHLNSNQLITKSVHHLNNLNTFNNNNLNQQSNSSYFNLNKNHHLNNYQQQQQHNFYLTPNYHPFYHHHYPYQEKGLYRINSALNLDQYEFETNLKREFGSVSSIGALSNNYPHTNHHFNHHHLNQIYPITNSTPIHHTTNQHTNNSIGTNQQEHLLSFYSILKEFKKQNLDNHHQTKQLNFVNNPQANKIQDYLRARNSEMSNIDLVNSTNLNLITKTTATHLNDSHHKLKQHFTVTDGAFTKLNNHHQHHHSSYLISTNELNNSNSLSAYSNHSLSNKQLNHLNQLNNQQQITANLNNTNLITGSNLTLDSCGIQPSPRLKKKIYKIWEIKSDKNSSKNQKLKMSSESSTNKNDNNSTTSVDGATRAIIKKFTRIGSSKNVNCNNSSTNNNNEQNAIQEEYRSSLNAAASTTHLNDDPEIRMEEKLRKKAFAHYDCQSLIANLNGATRLCHLLSKRRNTTTGASAASIISKQNLSALELENSDIDNGDERSNDLLLSCPYFRNELGGEEERMISLNRITADQTNQNNSNKRIFIHKPNMTCGLALLEDANERRWKLKQCPYLPYQKLSTINTPNLENLFLIENNDVGATYYRNHFYGLEHQNWFGIDDNLGPIAISIRRERIPLENCLVKKNSNPLTSDNNNVNSLSTTISNSTNTISQTSYKNQYRLIIRTSELNVLRGTVFEDCVPNLNLKNNNHNNHHAKEIIDYIASEINLSCLRLGQSNADEQLLRLDEQAQTGKYKVGVLYCKSGQSSEEEMYNNEFGGPAFDEFLTCLGKRIRLKGFDKYRAGLDNKKDTTGLYSVYATFAGCELMFHVSTLLPYTTDKQQILRKQHIGNDIVTIVFQEPDACQFTPKLIRSHFQHVFIIVKVLPSLNGPPKYSVAVSRSKDVPVFGPIIPENGIFTKSKQFTDFLLSKIINAENAAHRSEKFKSMAQRTRHEYLKELAQKFVTNTTINDSNSSAGSKLVSSIFGGSKKSRSARTSRDSHFIGDSIIKGAICWEMWVEDFGQSRVIDCLVAISSDSFVIIEESTKDLIFVTPNISILGWNSHPNYIKIFYHQGECILLKCKDPDLDEINEMVNRLKNVTNGCETQEIILKRNHGGQLGFRVSFEGIITQVDPNTHAWLSGLRRYARIVEICKVAIATLTHEQMQDLLKTSITVSITTLPPLDENTPRRGCNLKTCSYVTNPIAFSSSSNLSSNYENVNNAFDRFGRNQQQLNNGLLANNYLNTSNSNVNTGLLNYSNNQSINSNQQHQLMGLPTANTMPSRTNCSSPSVSITSKSNYSPTTGIGLLSSNGLSRSKTMLDSSTSSSKKSGNLLCSVPSTPLPFNNQSKQFIKNSNTASIASSIQDSLNQLSLSTTSSQTNTNNSTNLTPQVIECSDLGLPTEAIKINLPTSKQTSDYNSDTSSSNEWNSNTWSLSLENSNNRTKSANDDKFVCPKTVINNSKFKTPFNVQQPNLTTINKTADKYTSTTPTASANSTLLRNQTNSRQSNLNGSNNKSTTNSTLQEDLLRLINPDSYLSSPDNLTENLNSSNPASNESSNTQYSTPYSSLERSNTSCSNTNSNNQSSTNEDKIIAQSALVSSFNNQLQRQLDKQSIDHFNRQQSKLLEKSNSMDYLCKIDKQSTDNKKSQSAIKSKKFSFDSNSAFASIDQDWPNLISNAAKALAVTQQANSLPTTSLVQTTNNKISTLKNELQQLNNKAGSLKENDDCSKDETTCPPSPATIATAKLNQHRNSLDQWILEFENFSKNAAGNLFGNESMKQFSTSGNSSVIDQVEDDCFQQTTTRNQMELSQLDTEKVKNLESRLKQLQSDLVKEQSNKMNLESQVRHLEEENRRLHTESITAAAQLRKFTEWFFSNIKN